LTLTRNNIALYKSCEYCKHIYFREQYYAFGNQLGALVKKLYMKISCVNNIIIGIVEQYKAYCPCHFHYRKSCYPCHFIFSSISDMFVLSLNTHTAQNVSITLQQRCKLADCTAILQRYWKIMKLQTSNSNIAATLQKHCKNIVMILIKACMSLWMQ